MELKKYQEKAIDKLYREVIDQLDTPGLRRKIIFQAPTGAGKTVMATETLSRLHQFIQDEDCQYNKVAFIWLAPNALHIQSYLAMKSVFSESNILEPVIYDELDLGVDGYIHPGQVFFVNWQSINKENNIIVRGSEQIQSIYDYIARTKENNIALICVIDEEHMFAGDNANKSEKVLSKINPKVELRISATPETRVFDTKISIPRQEVISAGMIKQNISLNPAMRDALAKHDDMQLNRILLNEALKKRQQIADAYKSIGVNINPLLLIQLPNDDDAKMSREEDDLKNNLIQQLSTLHGINTDNERLAIWLADEKVNLSGIEEKNSITDVLLFKQAIALGWDCPRAAVLLIFRKLSSFTFTIQTVGRIMRMPQQHFYGNSLLDIGYVYTDLSADRIKIEPDDAVYINKLHSTCRDGLQNILLTSYKEERSNKENNILRSDFRKIFRKMMSEEWTLSLEQELLFGDENFMEEEESGVLYQANRIKAKQKFHIQFDVARIQIEIPTDMELKDEEGEYKVTNKTGYARSMDELQQVFDRFCGSLLSGWSKQKALPLLEDTLVSTMELLFGLNEWEAIKVILYHDNQPKFRDFVAKVLNHYKKNVMEKISAETLGHKSFEWEVPAIRDYNDSANHYVDTVTNHALLPFVESNDVYGPEVAFTKFLEQNSKYIDWWYKNADNGSEHFAVKYTNSENKEHLFYVDYVIRMKNGTICLFDTKAMGGDKESVNKHNALIDYLKAESVKRGVKMVGGIIIEDNGNWWYSPLYISNAKDITSWSSFLPDQYK